MLTGHSGGGRATADHGARLWTVLDTPNAEPPIQRKAEAQESPGRVQGRSTASHSQHWLRAGYRLAGYSSPAPGKTGSEPPGAPSL